MSKSNIKYQNVRKHNPNRVSDNLNSYFGYPNRALILQDQSRIGLFLFCILTFAFCIFSLFPNLIWAQNPLKIYCIDVNQGDATLIVSPTNKYVLIDAGHITGNYGDTVFKLLQNLGISHLDHIIASHYHEDHIGGIPRVINKLGGIDLILYWCYDRGDTYTSPTYLNYLNAVRPKRRTIGLGETLNIGGGAFMFCVAKNGKVVNGDSVLPNPNEENYRSLAFILKYGFFEFFIGGDLDGSNQDGRRDVETKVAPVVRNIDVLRVNHHGSKYSSNRTFLDSLRPEVSIISLGNNSYGYPFQEVIDSLVRRNSYIYQLNNNPSGGGIIPPECGRILNTHAVITVNNINYIVNGDTYPIDGVRRDGAVLEILSPKDTITEGAIVTPKALIKNLGNITESFRIRFKIGTVYNRTKTISNLAPNDTITIAFDTTWTAVQGNYQVKCSTEVPQDLDITNDRKTANLTVAFFDAELKEIVVPVSNDTFYTNETITPKAVVKDNSMYANPTLVKVYCQISSSSFYLDSVQRVLNPGSTDTIVFTPKSLSGLINGVYRCSTWIKRNSDLVPANNFKSVRFVINIPYQRIWEKLTSLSSFKGVKDGGCLVSTDDRIYAFIGNNTNKFYSFDPTSNSWQEKCSIPYGLYLNVPQKKRVKKGAALTYGENSSGNKTIYALRGNNTQQFWRYDIQHEEWNQLPDVQNQKVKAGSGLAYVSIAPDSKYVYCLKGSDKNYQFWAYDIIHNQWIQRDDAPQGLNYKPFKDGSCIVAVGDTIYALKGGAKYNEFYYYDVRQNDWFEVESIPQYNPFLDKKKKIKAGGALAYEPNSNKIYAFKGGGTQEFWYYDISTRTWTPKETIPLGIQSKKGNVKAGAGLASFSGKIYALKGNNSKEFWRYIPSASSSTAYTPYSTSEGSVSTAQVSGFRIRDSGITITATVNLYNISGQLVKSKQITNCGNITRIGLFPEFKDIKPGVYFIQITGGNKTISTKLIRQCKP